MNIIAKNLRGGGINEELRVKNENLDRHSSLFNLHCSLSVLLSREFCARFAFSCALAALLAAPSAQASFLGDLAANPSKVLSSPYATGGDVILKLGEAEYVHVFTNTTAAATFTPTENLTAWVLVVGGGGGGNSCNGSIFPGGAGGGGFVEEKGVELAVGDHAVTVGAGGAGIKSSSGYKDGGASSFAVSAQETVVAYGGGASTRAAGRDGASPSGGAYANGTSCDPGFPVYGDQGCEGYPGHRMGGGGGGGAGGAAKAPYGTSQSDPKRYGSVGGDGRASGILGFVQYFGGGGGGASSNNTGYRTNPGGAGGGGTGGASGLADRSDAYGGENGLGGGAGGVYQASNSGVAGKGGDGIVVVRYAVSASGAPVLCDVAVSCAGGASAVPSATVAFAGATDATVYFKAWPSSGSEGDSGTVVLTVGTAAAGTSYDVLGQTLGGLSFDTDYSWKVWAENAAGSSAASTGTISTHSTSLAATATGATVTELSGGLHKIFTFTEDGTFTVPTGRTGFAKILVVGGGGAGGYGGGGGGGGGGVVYEPEVYLEAGTYAVTVGAGGAAATTSGNISDRKGDASSFGSLLAVEGGGAGPNPYRPSNHANDSYISGASSAGTFAAKFSNAGIDGQGHAGGNACKVSGSDQVNNACGYSSGGGGAGSAGADATATGGGDGGAGLACGITGETLCYGAGGGGSYYNMTSGTAGAGGAGGGGNGGDADGINGTDGTFYGAGGGSGALIANNSKFGTGGAGYQGVVIVRYTDYAKAGDAPLVEILSADDVTTDSATLAVSVPYAGTGASTVALTVAFAYEEGGAAVSSLTKTCSGFIGSQTLAVEGLCPGRTYYVTATADNGTATATATSSFTTAAMFSKALTYTSAGGVLGYTIDGAADGTQRFELWVGPDASSMTNQATYTDASLMTAGSHSVTPFATEQFGETVSMLLRHIAVVGDHAFTNDTAVLSRTLTDGATYEWKSDVAEGDWCDAANWTASTTPGRGWPIAGSTAKFPAMTATACIDRAVTVARTQFTANGAVTLKGTVAAASLTTGFASDTTAFPAGAWTLDAIAVVRDPAGKVTMNNAGETLVLTNGASFANAGQDFVVNNGAALTVGPGSSLSAKSLGGTSSVGGVHPRIVVAGTVVSSGGINLSYGGAATKPATDLVLAGADARIKVNGVFYAQYTNATVTIKLEGTYSQAEALIRETGTTAMAASGGTLTFDVPRTRASKSVAKCDILVADWSKKSINTALVAFGAVDSAGSYFFYSDTATPPATKEQRWTSAEAVTAAGGTAKYLWYHHAVSPGMVLTVR